MKIKKQYKGQELEIRIFVSKVKFYCYDDEKSFTIQTRTTIRIKDSRKFFYHYDDEDFTEFPMTKKDYPVIKKMLYGLMELERYKCKKIYDEKEEELINFIFKCKEKCNNFGYDTLDNYIDRIMSKEEFEIKFYKDVMDIDLITLYRHYVGNILGKN